ncbi:hypothetical protein BAUCODRAFT_470759 [Baudoinia panamericana UAMH 10762]|uniref:U4/U6.U5 small nuclear ribonucleoprotein 27kDa protein domain-containing protein n=1 Tax=Baudoinia panamericana (strain UAMH 10762) TaxID=717646 RepID=M2NBP7_BAUPA|nr:uncharacterized protein BAUCODRAFT_470759 [Baudoinia panamericana UAMH 10762]EMC96335.1 hypothetical protein BAUCODRAFT_470759 [Baudoinia panamericana UAMH 10762]
MDRNGRPDERRRQDARPRHGTLCALSRDHNSHVTNAFADRDRSRSPLRRDRRDDHRRDRSPYRPPRGGGGSRPVATQRGRGGGHAQPPSKPAGGRPGPDRRPFNDRSNMRNETQPKLEHLVEPSTDIKMEDLDEEEVERRMLEKMGFKSFRSTKNTKVPGNDKNYGVHKVKKSEYRQYMNRVGGFNRPLSPTRL